MTRIDVSLGERSYPIAIDEDGVVGAFARSRSAASAALVVGDANTASHAGAVATSLAAAGFRVARHDVPAGEGSKCLTQASALYDALAGMRADRRTLVVPVGGGVVGDLAGFAAATYNRGLPLLMVPTTLLAMVDSSVGGKVGINHPAGKNLIGSFHQPLAVWIDTATLVTLPEREYLSGLAEVVKYGVILDAEFFGWLEGNAAALRRRDPAAVRHVVGRSCRLKADVVEKDEFERTGLRAALNYGHTFAHAFEAVAGYGSWLHGEAVAAGMACAARLAASRGLIGPDVVGRQRALLEALGLPTEPGAWPAGELLAAMRTDKKAEAGRLRFVLPVRLGEVRLFDGVTDDEARAALG
ncbi:MAG: 3-dehydroquinate synthase [Gemmataceae bacterium]